MPVPILKLMSGRTVMPAPPPSMHDTLTSRGASLVPSSPSDRAELLDQTEWSRRFSWKTLEILATYVRPYLLPTGRTLFKEGDHDAFLGVVVEGGLDIVKNDSAEQPLVVGRVGRGKMVGEMSLLDGNARSATAIGAETTTLIVLSKEAFDQLAVDHPAIALELTTAIATAIAQLLRQTTGTLVEYLGG